jgi:cytidylate kinase
MVGKQGELGFFRKIFLYISTFFNLANRRRADGRRYMELYDVEYSKPEKYNDIVLDTSNIDEKETFNLILEKFKDGRYFE